MSLNKQDYEIAFRSGTDDYIKYENIKSSMAGADNKKKAKELADLHSKDIKVLWEAYHLTSYLKALTDQDSKFENSLDAKLERTRVNCLSKLMKMPSDKGITKENSEVVFIKLAELEQCSKLEVFVRFLEFNQDKPFILSGFKEDRSDLREWIRDLKKYIEEEKHKPTIANLKSGEYESSDSAPKLPLQDTLAISKELKRIKEDIGVYPYDKDKFGTIDNAKYRTALEDIKNLLVVFPENVDLMSLQIRVLSFLRKYEDALPLAEKLYKQYPLSIDVVISYILVLKNIGRFEEVLQISEEYRSIKDVDNPLFHLHVGLTLNRLERYEEAVEEFESAIRIDPSFIVSYSSLSKIYVTIKQYTDSEIVLRNALEIFPDDETLGWQLVSVLENQLSQEESEELAIKLFKKASSSNALAKTMLKAFKLMRKEEYSKAHDILKDFAYQRSRNALIENSSKSRIFGVLANSYEVVWDKQGQKNKYLNYAIECREISLDYNPQNIDSLENLALLKFVNNAHDQSKKLIIKAAEIVENTLDEQIQPLDVFVKFISKLKYMKGIALDDWLKPLLWYNEKYDDSPFGYLGLASVSLSKNDFLSARSNIDQALKRAKCFLAKQKTSMLETIILNGISGILKKIIIEDNGYDQYFKTINSILEKCKSEQVKKLSFHYWMSSVVTTAELYHKLGVDKNNLDFLKISIHAYEIVLAERIRHSDTLLWLQTNLDMSSVYLNLSEITKNPIDIEKSISYLSYMLEEIDPEEHANDYIITNKNIVKKYELLWDNFDFNIKYVKEGVQYLENLCNVTRVEEDSDYWLEIQFHLAYCFSQIGNESHSTECLVKSLDVYKNRHAYLLRSRNEELLIESHFFLGMANKALYDVGNDENVIKDAISNFNSVIEKSEGMYLSDAWIFLASIFKQDGLNRNNKGMLTKSVKACSSALELEMGATPKRANALKSLGQTYCGLGCIEKEPSFYRKEILLYKEAIEIYEDLGVQGNKSDYFYCLHYLAMALINIAKYRDNYDLDELEHAISLFDSVVDNMDIESERKLIAEAVEFRGVAKYFLYKAHENKKWLEEAKVDFTRSQDIYTKSMFPMEYARVEKSLEKIS
ncbi:MAG: tetratricopeptide repeat protein [Cellvibrionaceae bacterium]